MVCCLARQVWLGSTHLARMACPSNLQQLSGLFYATIPYTTFGFFIFYKPISRICAAEKSGGRFLSGPCPAACSLVELSSAGRDRCPAARPDAGLCAVLRGDVQRASLHLLAHQQRGRVITAAGLASKPVVVF